MLQNLFLCIVTLYQIISCIGDDVNISDKSNEENYGLGMVVTEENPIIKKENKEYEAEKKKGDIADLFGTNQHYNYPDFYKGLGRRFVPQYPYKEISIGNADELAEEEAEANLDKIVKGFQNNNLIEKHLIPVKAPPELVLAVAARAAVAEAISPQKPLEENIDKEILRSGDYWNNVWREDVDPNILRTQQDKEIQRIKVKFMPGSELYTLASKLKEISPRLVYVINKKQS